MAHCLRDGCNSVSLPLPVAVEILLIGHSCPRFEQCRCDVYGWCGPLPSGEVLEAITKGQN